MIILITKDGATKVPREVSTVAEVEAVIAAGFCVEQALGDGESRVLTLEDAAAVLEQESEAKAGEPHLADDALQAPQQAQPLADPDAKQAPAKKVAAKTTSAKKR